MFYVVTTLLLVMIVSLILNLVSFFKNGTFSRKHLTFTGISFIFLLVTFIVSAFSDLWIRTLTLYILAAVFLLTFGIYSIINGKSIRLFATMGFIYAGSLMVLLFALVNTDSFSSTDSGFYRAGLKDHMSLDKEQAKLAYLDVPPHIKRDFLKSKEPIVIPGSGLTQEEMEQKLEEMFRN